MHPGRTGTISTLVLAAIALSLSACGRGEGKLQAYADLKDPEVMLQRCFNGNPDGECTRFEAIYGEDPRTDQPCRRIGEKLKGCEEMVARFKKEAYG